MTPSCGDEVLFRYCSELAMGLALLRARYLDADVRQLTVWDRRAGPRRCGHGDRCRRLAAPRRRRHADSPTIDPRSPRSRVRSTRRPSPTSQ